MKTRASIKIRSVSSCSGHIVYMLETLRVHVWWLNAPVFLPRSLSTADPHVQYSAVSSFVFLRFFAVAVLSPHSFQLRSHHPVSARLHFMDKLESQFTRGLYRTLLSLYSCFTSRIRRFPGHSPSSQRRSRRWVAGVVCQKKWWEILTGRLKQSERKSQWMYYSLCRIR